MFPYAYSLTAYEGGHKISWKEAMILQIQPNTSYRKHKKSAHMPLVYHSISQTSLVISPIWPSIIEA
jgi:hypothetical protein